jgi:hypothetical protein
MRSFTLADRPPFPIEATFYPLVASKINERPFDARTI